MKKNHIFYAVTLTFKVESELYQAFTTTYRSTKFGKHLLTVWMLLHEHWLTCSPYYNNAVNFLPNPHNRHPIAFPMRVGYGVSFCEFNVWFMFRCCHCSALCNIMIYSTALYQHWSMYSQTANIRHQIPKLKCLLSLLAVNCLWSILWSQC